LVKTYTGVTFNHEDHVSLAGNCSVCHHEHGNPETMTCGGCHSVGSEYFKKSVQRNFSACNACHGSFDLSTPEMPTLKVAYHRACFRCHRGIASLGTDPKCCTNLCHGSRTVVTGNNKGND
jgi:NAD-dependent SIR2 family protein deacetylase